MFHCAIFYIYIIYTIISHIHVSCMSMFYVPACLCIVFHKYLFINYSTTDVIDKFSFKFLVVFSSIGVR